MEDIKDKIYEKLGSVGGLIKDNKDVVIPLVGGCGSYLISLHTGSFPGFDKLVHYSFGFGMSRLGRKIARKFNKEKHENLASLAMNLGASIVVELWEANPVTMSISNALSGIAYEKEFGLQTIDPFDLGASLAGCVTENTIEYVTRAKNGILKRIRKSEIK